MRTPPWPAGIGAVCAATLLATGCAPTTSGEPLAAPTPLVRESTTEKASGPKEPFDPCTIPAAAVNDSGLIADSALTGFAGITEYPGWKGCTWEGPSKNSWYFLAVLSSINSLDEYLRSPDNGRQVPIYLGHRKAVQYQSAYQGDPPTGCDIVLEASGSLIIFSLDSKGSTGTLGDPCAEVNRHAIDLEPYLPS